MLDYTIFNYETLLKRYYDKKYAEQSIDLLNQIGAIIRSATSSWIAGGFIRRILSKDKIEDADIDIFSGIKGRIQETEKLLLQAPEARILNRDENLTNIEFKLMGKILKFQVIKFQLFPNGIKDCLESFDIDLCKFAFYQNQIYANPYALTDLFKRQIHISSVQNPIRTFNRVQEYIDKGYTFPQEQIRQFFIKSGASIEKLKQETVSGK